MVAPSLASSLSSSAVRRRGLCAPEPRTNTRHQLLYEGCIPHAMCSPASFLVGASGTRPTFGLLYSSASVVEEKGLITFIWPSRSVRPQNALPRGRGVGLCVCVSLRLCVCACVCVCGVPLPRAPACVCSGFTGRPSCSAEAGVRHGRRPVVFFFFKGDFFPHTPATAYSYVSPASVSSTLRLNMYRLQLNLIPPAIFHSSAGSVPG